MSVRSAQECSYKHATLVVRPPSSCSTLTTRRWGLQVLPELDRCGTESRRNTLRCGLCGNLELYKTVAIRVFFEFELHELDASAHRGCPICRLLREGLGQFEPYIGDIDSVRRLCVHGRSATAQEGIRLHVFFEDDRPSLKLEFFLSASECRPIVRETKLQALGFRTSLRITGNRDSDEALSWLRARLDTCCKLHKLCNSTEQSLLPSQVVYIGQSTSDQSVRLIETTGETGRYACLSHCWGGVRSLTTERATLHLRREGMAWETLPKTFQDTIPFLRKLDIKYIWIDSLCIVQDDERDWHQESGKMAPIYRGAYLTVAAIGASRDAPGCFEDSNANQDYELMVDAEKDGRCSIFVREQIPHWGAPSFLTKENPFPLLRRAWIYQERMLSPRVIHLHKRELIWECMELVACECGEMNTGMQRKLRMHSQLSSAMFSGRFLETQEPEFRHSWRYHEFSKYLPNEAQYDTEWHNVVEEYSRLELTFDGDRLPAIAGLAEIAQRRHEGRYLAGLWEDTLIHDLIWYNNDSFVEKSKGRTGSYRALTWSWASVEADIAYKQKTGLASQSCNILEVDCTLADMSNARGKATGGFLTVLGRASPAIVRRSKRSGSAYYEILPDCSYEWHQFYPDYDFLAREHRAERGIDDYMWLEIGTSLPSSQLETALDIKRHEETTWALVLRQCDPSCMNDVYRKRRRSNQGEAFRAFPAASPVYERVGLVEHRLCSSSVIESAVLHRGRTLNQWPTSSIGHEYYSFNPRAFSSWSQVTQVLRLGLVLGSK